MEGKNNDQVLRDIIDNKANSLTDVGMSEDSGFASIAGSIADSQNKDDSTTTENSNVNLENYPDSRVKDEYMPIAQDVKFRTIDVKEMTIERGIKRKIKDRVEDDAKKKADEQYENQKKEQVYKRLMHLLTKSQFYSSYIFDKINGDTGKIKKSPTKGGKKPGKKPKEKETDENVVAPKKSHKSRRLNNKYDIREYVSADMKKRLDDQKKKMNLSEEDIEAELNSQSDSEDKQEGEASASTKFVNPKYFDGTLRDYQIDGFQWLKVLYENGVNGILADEMGLGKTVQVIALFAHLLEKRQDGPYLIIAPLSTIPNWLMEFERFAPNLPVVLFHGKQEARAAAMKKMKVKQPVADGYSTYPIMLTTYEVPLREAFFVRSFKWRYIVIDEGHRIKNHECQLLKVLNGCESMNRLLLTGTPLQNNLAELWSLLHFLLPEIFDDLAVFESWFSAKELQEDEGTEKVLKQEEEKHVLSSLREILKPFMLRRVKTDVCLDIPPKKEMIVYAPLTELQHDLYGAVLNHDLQVLSKIQEKPDVSPDGPTRPKRKCTTRNKYSSSYVDIYNVASDDSSRASSPMSEVDFDINSNWRKEMNDQPIDKTVANKNLAVWRQYTDINVRNCDFFVRLRFGSRAPMYKQIVNHPWLLHCPLDVSGQPEISENMVKASGKLLVLDAMLKKLKAQGHKVLLFSTMTMILDIIADYLTMRPWRFLMLTGRHDIDFRQENIKLFNTDPDIFLFLISTRAGGVGLNLAGADTVIVYDSDWNPQADLQAMARCHRIGQTRPVVVYRMCTKGTIDERIISRAEAKRKLEKMVISKETGLDLKNANTLMELKRLLDSTESTIVSAEKEVYTEAELDKILDRSDLIWPARQESTSIKCSDSD